jgi:hypothetical protein
MSPPRKIKLGSAEVHVGNTPETQHGTKAGIKEIGPSIESLHGSLGWQAHNDHANCTIEGGIRLNLKLGQRDGFEPST